MRITALLLTLATTACLGPVGTDRKTGRGSGSGSGSGSNDGTCEKVQRDVTIRTAADMADLPKTGCYDIFGKLTVQGSTVTSLVGLNQLNSVDELDLDHTNLATIDTQRPIGIYGRLTVTGNTRLTSLKPLEFEIPATGILIDGNPALTSLDPLTDNDPKLAEIDGDLVVTGNTALAQLALPNLTKVTGATTIQNNSALTTVDFSKLATSGAIELADNAKLTQLTGFAATTVNGDLVVRNNAALASLGTMSDLYRITGNLTIDNNPLLANLGAFTTSVKYVDLMLTVTNNAALTDLGALKHLSLVGAVTITNNTKLSVCRALEIDRCVQHATQSVISGNDNTNCNWQCN